MTSEEERKRSSETLDGKIFFAKIERRDLEKSFEKSLIDYLLEKMSHGDRKRHIVDFALETEKRNDLLPLEKHMIRRYLYDTYIRVEMRCRR